MKFIIMNIILESGGLLITLLPSILIGSLLSAILLKKKWLIFNSKIFHLRNPLIVFFASILGAVSPVCTVGTIPIITGMVQNGLSLGAAASFIIASAIITPQMVIIGISAVGWKIILVQIVSGLLLANITGYLIMLIANDSLFMTNQVNYPEEKMMKSIDRKAGRIHKNSSKNSIFTLFLNQLEFILIYLTGGVVLAAVLKNLLPDSLLYDLSGKANPVFIFLASVTSIPTYVCGGASLAFMGGMTQAGFSSAIIVAFLIAGPATRMQNLGAISSLIKTRFVVIFSVVVVLYATLIGIIYNAAS